MADVRFLPKPHLGFGNLQRLPTTLNPHIESVAVIVTSLDDKLQSVGVFASCEDSVAMLAEYKHRNLEPIVRYLYGFITVKVDAVSVKHKRLGPALAIALVRRLRAA